MNWFASATDLAGAIRARRISPLEALNECLQRADAINPNLNAVIWRNDEDARRRAKDAGDVLVRADLGSLAPFHGVPVPVKDLTEVNGWPVSYGSRAASGAPSDVTEVMVSRLQAAGFLLTGRTNTPELGLLTATENLRYGPSRNPWDVRVTPGGSSGGAAAAVASGMFPLAHATDGGGSIRIPASCCGIVGLKPSRGRIPRLRQSWAGGVVDGVLTRTVADSAAVLDVVSQPDPGAWYNASRPERPFLAELDADPAPLRAGIVETVPFGLDIDDECLAAVRSAADVLSDLGHEVRRVAYSLPEEFFRSMVTVANAGFGEHPDFDWDLAEPHVQAARQSGLVTSSIEYVSAVHRLQRLTRERTSRWGADIDVLVTPTMAILPPAVGTVMAAAHAPAGTSVPTSIAMRMGIFTCEFNMTGQPAISLPWHLTAEGLPVGVQFVAGPWREAVLLGLAAQLERAVVWADRQAPVCAPLASSSSEGETTWSRRPSSM